jgi:hypothetical protein
MLPPVPTTCRPKTSPTFLSPFSGAISCRMKTVTARVEAIREHVAAGSYDVPAEDVADALVAFFRRDFLPDQDRNAGFVAKSC